MDYDETERKNHGEKILETPQTRRDFLRKGVNAGGALIGAMPLVGLAGKALAADTRELTDKDVQNLDYVFENSAREYGAVPFTTLNPEYNSWKFERTQIEFPLNGLHIPTSSGMEHLGTTGSNPSGGEQLPYHLCFDYLFKMMGHRSMKVFDTKRNKAEGLTHEGQFLEPGIKIGLRLRSPRRKEIKLVGFEPDQEVREKFSRITNYHSQQEGEPLYNWMFEFLKTVEDSGGDSGGSDGGGGGAGSGGGNGDGGTG